MKKNLQKQIRLGSDGEFTEPISDMEPQITPDQSQQPEIDPNETKRKRNRLRWLFRNRERNYQVLQWFFTVLLVTMWIGLGYFFYQTNRYFYLEHFFQFMGNYLLTASAATLVGYLITVLIDWNNKRKDHRWQSAYLFPFRLLIKGITFIALASVCFSIPGIILGWHRDFMDRWRK